MGKSKVMAIENTGTEEAQWLSWVERRFREIAGKNGELDMDQFQKALNLKQTFIGARFFTLFDTDNSGTVALQELMDGLWKVTHSSPEEKLKFLFDVYDVDGSGTIDMDELKTVLTNCMEESDLSLDEGALDSLTHALFDSADTDNSGEVTFEELLAELKRHPGVLENLTISAAQWLTPPQPKKKKKPGSCQCCTKRYLKNNGPLVGFLIIYTLVNIGLFILSAVRYRTSNGFIIVARGCGMCLNFNCAFVVVMMLRTCLTWLRGTKAASIFPIDDSVYIHKMVGFVIGIQSVIHTLAHLGNLYLVVYDSPELEIPPINTTGPPPPAPLQYWEYLFTLRSGLGWIGPGFAFLSGVILDVILLIMTICSLPFVRRKGYFQVFYWTHILYIAFWVLTILHGPIFWYFFIVPGFIFLCESIGRSHLIKLAKFGKVYIEKVSLLPSKVTHLVISRPAKFEYRPGDYVFIKIPAIARNEWHPFTISSAPELKDHIWLHVRSVGHWTNKLYAFFDEQIQSECAGVVHSRSSSAKSRRSSRVSAVELQNYKTWREKHGKHVNPKRRTEGLVHAQVIIDGPYGTPTRDIFSSEHAVLIGSGIGVTPFAAILQSIMFRYQATKVTCPSCNHNWYRSEAAQFNMRKVDFIWINRGQHSFEWFVRLLAQIEIQQAQLAEDSENPFLEMQLFMSNAASKNDMKGLGLQMAMEIMHNQGQRDILTGLRTRTQPGRPDWRRIFTKISEKRAGKVKVFFCGAPVLAKQLSDYCQRYGFSFKQESF